MGDEQPIVEEAFCMRCNEKTLHRADADGRLDCEVCRLRPKPAVAARGGSASTALASLVLLFGLGALGWFCVNASKDDDWEPTSAPAAAPRQAPPAVRPAPPAPPAPRPLDEIYVDALKNSGTDVRSQADSKAGREIMAEALGVYFIERGVQAAVYAEGRALVIGIFGGECTKEAIVDLEESTRPALKHSGFRKIRCNPEGHTVNVR
jgi:hypothetical protein